ncbi:CoA transferase [Geodermatophilus sabuli]|uniref:CoA transferase n=1 Tax=Geodermatophilus sabuli TaxID=1564158 RepID=A0A7K3VW34_9ACTN|nr:CoA transferase [Geodermatophilus sabuli]NEK56855.1 CoA transferase [Geodermatophilus sabuli]
MGILDGLKVLDFGSAVAGPYASMLMADMGASVVKVEKVKRGDLIRFTDHLVNGKSGYFLGINRGKRGITLDLRTPEGQAVALRLCASADVLIENFRPGMMDGWGLSYEEVKAVNPDIVYCSVSAFGGTKGFETESGNDIVAQAYSGLMAMTGDPDGAPAKAGTPVTDVAASCMATISVLAALLRRKETGQGARVKTSLLDASYALMANYTPSILNGTPSFRRQGSGHPQLAPYEAYTTGDGKYLVIGAFHNESWRRLCAALDRPDLENDPRVADNTSRVENRKVLAELINGELLRRTAEEWLAILRDHDVPVAPVLEVEESMEFFTQRNAELYVDGIPSNAGEIRMLRAPFEIDGERPYHPQGAPRLGEHTDEVLREEGFTQDEIDGLRAREVI